MGRIGANISGIERTLLNRLAEANAAATLNSLRLATGEKINAPRDNPSGFAALSALRNQRNTISSTLTNVTAASTLASETQSTLDKIRTELDNIRTLAVADQDQALSPTARAENQAAIDASLAKINTLANTTISSRRVLDGSANFSTSGANPSQVAGVQASSLGASSSQDITGTVTLAATQATLSHAEGSGLITNNATFTLAGDRGGASISVTNGESLATVATRINQESHLTGVTASVSGGGTSLDFTSIEFGASAEVSLTLDSGTFTTGSATGGDATATINGRNLTGDGNRFVIAENGFQATVEFQGGFSGAFSDITVSGDALSFALSTDLNQRATLAVPGLQTAKLGGLSGRLDQLASGGSAAGLNTNAPLAIRIVDEALADLDRIEGAVDGFAANTVDSSSALLTSFETEVNKGIDAINLVDSDEENLLLAKNQLLALNAQAGLAVLNQQRTSILELVRHAAGFR